MKGSLHVISRNYCRVTRLLKYHIESYFFIIIIIIIIIIIAADVLGVVRSANDVATVTGRQSKKEISKRDVQLVDQSGMVVNLTLWGSDVSI